MAATKASSQRLAPWIFGGIAFAFLIGVFILWPEDGLSPVKNRILGIMCALLAGLFGYFFTGSMKLVTEGTLSRWGKVSI
jgi:drug/metabolite transporter (DMT)-like permease